MYFMLSYLANDPLALDGSRIIGYTSDPIAWRVAFGPAVAKKIVLEDWGGWG